MGGSRLFPLPIVHRALADIFYPQILQILTHLSFQILSSPLIVICNLFVNPVTKGFLFLPGIFLQTLRPCCRKDHSAIFGKYPPELHVAIT